MHIYKEFARKRHPEACQVSSGKYLQQVRKPVGNIWFVNTPMGKNCIGSIAKKMFQDAGLTYSRKTNHWRKTEIQSLLHAGIAPTEV